MSSTGQCRQFAASGTCTYGDKCRFQHGGVAPVVKRPKRRPRKASIPLASSPLREFFSEFTLFTYDPTAAPTEEFYRLGKVYGWGYESAAKEEARQRFKDAMVKEFNTIYGTDENDINAWHGLCRVLDISPLPETLEVCREKVKGIYVNLVDLVRDPSSNDGIHKFPSELALSEYSKETHKIFPRHNAYAGGLLRFLLRQIDNPPLHSVPKKRQRRR